MSKTDDQILDAISTAADISGKELRQIIGCPSWRAPGFYQRMAKLEDAGLVIGFYVPLVIDGVAIKERRYRLTEKGAKG